MKILFVASLHHPEELRAAIAQTPSGARPPIFPPSMSQHFWEKALIKRGHTLDVYWRNLPIRKTQKHSERLTPGKLFNAALNRIPPQLNPDGRRKNAGLLAKARAFRPDVLWMVGDNTVIVPETLATIKRELGCKLIYACGTSPIVFSHPIDRASARQYDLVLANDYYHGVQWLELGAKRMECLPLSACDPDFHHPYALTDEERRRYTCDIAFVGTLVPDHLYSRRVQALEALREFDIGIWSVHDVPASLKPFVRGKALGEEMLKILSSAKICFNTHGDFVYYGGNLRLFEVAGAGICQLAEDLPGTRAWFPVVDGGATILTYTDLTELRATSAHYLRHDDERRALAQRAQTHVYAHHTYDHRAAKFDELMQSLG
ncbi:MAG: glycosyltransferase [Chloroflexi bacterium]|uniref:CgeB family protein n=1 Tax=Candidatus Flexifilum breve TaxID=3140694 RepID=UPI00313541BC|nr:glycosyltransferase [Chloroflexota bacterium]